MNATRTQIGMFIGAFVVAVALVLSGLAYSNANAWAVRVNGREISERQLLDELSVFANNAAVQAAVDQANAQSGLPPVAPRNGGVSSDQAAGWIMGHIFSELLADIAREENIPITTGSRQETEQSIAQGFGGQKEWDKLPRFFRAELVERNVRETAVITALSGTPSEDDLRRQYAASEDEFLQACAAHILVATEEEALAFKAQLDAGADFAAVAQASSLDTTSGANGGDLGCQRRGSYVEPFDSEVFTQPIDTVSAPIQTQFGFHLIKVASRDLAPFEDVRPELEQRAASESQGIVTDAILKALRDADIEVNPKYCVFSFDEVTGPECVPPEAPSPPDELPVGGDAPAEELLPPGLLPTGP